MNLIEQPFYIVGQHDDALTGRLDYLQLVFTPTRTGWTQRCAQNKEFNFDYMSRETIPQLRQWMKCDFERTWHFREKEAAAHFLQKKLSSASPKKSGLLSSWDDVSK